MAPRLARAFSSTRNNLSKASRCGISAARFFSGSAFSGLAAPESQSHTWL